MKKKIPDVIYHKQARMITLTQEKIKEKKGKILVVTAGTSDIPIAEEAVVTAEIMGNSVEKCYDVGVAGIHLLFDIKDSIVFL